MALLPALEGCFEGHESFHKAGTFYRDISINNPIVNEDNSIPLWRAFFINLDLAIKEEREAASEVRTGPGRELLWQLGQFWASNTLLCTISSPSSSYCSKYSFTMMALAKTLGRPSLTAGIMRVITSRFGENLVQ